MSASTSVLFVAIVSCKLRFGYELRICVHPINRSVNRLAGSPTFLQSSATLTPIAKARKTLNAARPLSDEGLITPIALVRTLAGLLPVARSDTLSLALVRRAKTSTSAA